MPRARSRARLALVFKVGERRAVLATAKGAEWRRGDSCVEVGRDGRLGRAPVAGKTELSCQIGQSAQATKLIDVQDDI